MKANFETVPIEAAFPLGRFGDGANESRQPRVIMVKQHKRGLEDALKDFLYVSEDAERRDNFLRILSGVEENQESDALVEGDVLTNGASTVGAEPSEEEWDESGLDRNSPGIEREVPTKCLPFLLSLEWTTIHG
jgi:hypothetical protein